MTSDLTPNLIPDLTQNWTTDSTLDFTVAIPVYNGADRVHRVIDRLRSQLHTTSLDWEILVIDNNSRDNLAEAIADIQSTWSHPFPLRYILEPKQGLTFARACAVDAAKGKYVGFLDDDNLAHPNWVRAAYDFGVAHPQVGAYGGKIQAELDSPTPAGWNQIKNFLAVRSLGNQPQPFDASRLHLPAGAGLVIRKQAWIECIPQDVVRVTRGGDDYQISLYMHNQGWQIWYNPEMVIDHHIPSWRMTTDYISSQALLYGSITCELQMIVVPFWQRPFKLLKGFAGAIKRLGSHCWQYGYPCREGMATQCTRAFYWGNVISPWMYLRNGIQQLWSK